MKKFMILISTVLLFSGLLAIPVLAEGNDDVPRYEAAIWDEADLLTDEEETALIYEMEELRSYGNVIFSTTVLDKGADYEKNSQDLYYKYYGNQPGILFQIDMGNRKLTLTASTQMEEYIKSERESIVDNIYQLASGGNYYACASECFSEVKAVLNDERIAHKMKHINNALLALILALVLNFLLVFYTTTKKKNLAASLLAGSVITGVVTNAAVSKGRVTKIYSPVSSSSGSGGSSGGGSSGGGGGFSGGSSSHGF